MITVYWSSMIYDGSTLYMAATEKGLCYVGTPLDSYDDFVKWIRKWFPQAELVKSSEKMAPYQQAIQYYLVGESTNLTIPLELKGTPFQIEVWQALQEIPYGATVSYSSIAERVGRATAVRAVGSAIGANPIVFVVPCHRVISKNGTLGGFRGGLEMKQQLLQLEQKRCSS